MSAEGYVTERGLVRVGDTVRVGKGKSLWRIYAFGHYANGTPYAALEVVDGYSNTSAELHRLTVVAPNDEVAQ